MLSTLLLLSASLAVPPCDAASVVASGTYTGQPVIRRFENRGVDDARRLRWEAHCRRLDALWAEYRAAGSTPEAFAAYRRAAAEAKWQYVAGDPYFVPIRP